MKHTTYIKTLAMGAIIATASATSAFAGLEVTFDPTGAGLGGSITPFQSNIQVGSDDSLAIIQSNGAFTENGVLQVSGFNNNGSTIGPLLTGVGVNYQLYVTFSATGQLSGWDPTNPTNANGTFSTLNFSIIGIPGTATTVNPPSVLPNPNGTPSVLSNTAGAITLATGSTIVGSAVSIETGVPAATVELGLTQAGTSFFAAPPGINEFLAAFTNNTGTFTFGAEQGDGQINLAIEGSFDESFDILPAPEPASLAVLGTGILGLAGFARRRHNNK